jgi:hypothetical protein
MDHNTFPFYLFALPLLAARKNEPNHFFYISITQSPLNLGRKTNHAS